MKILKYLLCFVFLCAAVVTVPAGCGPGKSEKLDPADYEAVEDDEEGEEDYDDGRGEVDG